MVFNESPIHPHVLSNSDHAKESLHQQYQQLKGQYARWQKQLQRNQAVLSHTTRSANSTDHITHVMSSNTPVSMSNGVTVKRTESDVSNLRYNNVSHKTDRVSRQYSLREDKKYMDSNNSNDCGHRKSILAERLRTPENHGGQNFTKLTLQNVLKGDDLIEQKCKLRPTNSSSSENISPNSSYIIESQHEDHLTKPKLVLGLKKTPDRTPTVPQTQYGIEPRSILRKLPNTSSYNAQETVSETTNGILDDCVSMNQSRTNVALRTGPRPYTAPKPYTRTISPPIITSQSSSRHVQPSGDENKILEAPPSPTQPMMLSTRAQVVPSACVLKVSDS